MAEAEDRPADGAAERLAVQRRRLGFRSWHRGTREMDLLLGSFADRHLPSFSAAQLDTYGRLLNEADPDLYDWISGRAPVPPGLSSDVMDLLCTHSLPRRS